MSAGWLPVVRRADRQLVRQSARDVRARAVAETAHALATARRERRLSAARRDLPVGLTVAGLGTAGLVLLGVGELGWVVGAGVLWASRAAAVLTGTPPVPPLPPAALGPAPLPGRRSAAWPHVVRLERACADLRRLLPLVGPGGREVAQQAWDAAAQADAALRWQAARLAGVEPHRGADPELLGPLEQGVREQEQLVRAVADLVAASGEPAGSSRLRDAADAVHGLAAGLREVR